MSNPFTDLPVPPECRETIRAGALVAINHSGGKDSQAMTILLSRLVPHDQLIVIHAPLGEVEWPGTVLHIENTIPPGVPLIMAPVTSGKTLLEQVEERGLWPSSSARWCTSGAKRGPIERELRRYLIDPPALRGTARQRARASPRREPRPRAPHPLAAQRTHERRRPRGLRLAAGVRAHDGERVPGHRRGRPVAAPGLLVRADALLVLVLHLRVAFRPAPRGGAPPGPLRKIRAARMANRPYALAHTEVSAGADRHSGR